MEPFLMLKPAWVSIARPQIPWGLRDGEEPSELTTTAVITEHPFNAEFEVAEANATISATGMNVFYRGIPNPVAISAGGVAESAVDARIIQPQAFEGSNLVNIW